MPLMVKSPLNGTGFGLVALRLATTHFGSHFGFSSFTLMEAQRLLLTFGNDDTHGGQVRTINNHEVCKYIRY